MTAKILAWKVSVMPSHFKKIKHNVSSPTLVSDGSVLSLSNIIRFINILNNFLDEFFSIFNVERVSPEV